VLDPPRSWGHNFFGALGDGGTLGDNTQDDRQVPTAVVGPM
jgi:hypothetical protein